MENWLSASVESNGINIHYHRTGSDAPALLFIHGFTDNGLCWSRVARELEADYDILMLDSRGHGLSDNPHKGYSADDHAADVVGVVEALDLGTVIILGHSVGAITAATVAANYPQLVRGLILEDPIWRDQEKHSTSGAIEKKAAMAEAVRHQIITQQHMSTQQIEASGREKNPSWDPGEFPAWVQAKQQVSPNVVDTLSSLSGNWKEVAAKFQCPTLLITGNPEKDVVVSPAVVAQAQSINPLIQHTQLVDAGHNIRRESFQQYVSSVRYFMSSLIA
ncbi:MAG: alpha/beta hydrolase [Oceanicoccus sp.]